MLTNGSQNFLQIFPKILKIFYKFFQKYSKFSTIFLSKFLFHLRMFYILLEKLTNDFSQIFQNFLETNFKILLYLLYFNVKIFVYFIQNLSCPYKEFTFIFYKLKNFPRVFFEFRWISPISLKFSEIIPPIYSKLLKFSRIFSQHFHF